MAEHPIVMNAQDIRAILEGRKTQIRRPVKFPIDIDGKGVEFKHGIYIGGWRAIWQHRKSLQAFSMISPFGSAGDTLWVKEQWYQDRGNPDNIVYAADNLHVTRHSNARWIVDIDTLDDHWKMRHAITMPRWESRITLRVEVVRVEYLQDISAEDAILEGAETTRDSGDPLWECVSLQDFRSMWDSIYAKRGLGWEPNPWVWVGEFTRIESDR